MSKKALKVKESFQIQRKLSKGAFKESLQWELSMNAFKFKVSFQVQSELSSSNKAFKTQITLKGKESF